MSSPAIAHQPCVHSLEMWPFDADVGRSVVCLSVCVLVTPMSPAKTTESVKLPFGADSCGYKEPCAMWATHRRHLANAIERSVLGGDAALWPLDFLCNCLLLVCLRRVAFSATYLQCLDAVGWAAGRASGL